MFQSNKNKQPKMKTSLQNAMLAGLEKKMKEAE